jgi:hypothetical protein
MLNKSKLNLYSLKPFLYIGIKGKEAKEERKKNRKTINMYTNTCQITEMTD